MTTEEPTTTVQPQSTPLQRRRDHDRCHYRLQPRQRRQQQQQQRPQLHIAPMLDVTGREFRQLMRILSKRAVLWTEMVVDTTILYTSSSLSSSSSGSSSSSFSSDKMDFHLGYEQPNSHPIVCQLGGSDPVQLKAAARTVVRYGYDEINLNMDCPSDRVAGRRQFGAVLMKQPDVAANAVRALHEASCEYHQQQMQQQQQQQQQYAGDDDAGSERPITKISVKTRIGVDDMDSLDESIRLIRRLRDDGGCRTFHMHARKAILGGKLNPAQNRSVPPLNYQHVYDLCRTFSDCEFYLNGGIRTLRAAKELCYGRLRPGMDDHNNDDVKGNEGQHHGVIPCTICNFPNGSCIAPPPSATKVPSNLCGVLLGRVALDNPCMLWDVDRYFYGEPWWF